MDLKGSRGEVLLPGFVKLNYDFLIRFQGSELPATFIYL